MGGKMNGVSTGFKFVDAHAQAVILEESLHDYGGVSLCTVAGSIRRSEEVVNDIDLVVFVDPRSEDNFEKFMHELGASWKRGERTQTQFPWEICQKRVQVDVFVTREMDRFGSQLLCWTGSKEWNVATRKWAQTKGMMLSQRGLHLTSGDIVGATEHVIFEKLGLPYLEPHARAKYPDIGALRDLSLGKYR